MYVKKIIHELDEEGYVSNHEYAVALTPYEEEVARYYDEASKRMSDGQAWFEACWVKAQQLKAKFPGEYTDSEALEYVGYRVDPRLADWVRMTHGLSPKHSMLADDVVGADS